MEQLATVSATSSPHMKNRIVLIRDERMECLVVSFLTLASLYTGACNPLPSIDFLPGRVKKGVRGGG